MNVSQGTAACGGPRNSENRGFSCVEHVGFRQSFDGISDVPSLQIIAASEQRNAWLDQAARS